MKYFTKYGLAAIVLSFGFIGMAYTQPVNQLYIYEKSNLDGSNKGQIAVYHANGHRIESFKWHAGNQHATLVRAKMDPKSHTVKRFEAYRVHYAEQENLAAVLEVSGAGTIDVRLGEQQQSYSDMPGIWHSYDFDFASLGFAFRSMQEGQSPITFHIVDLDLAVSPPALKDFGTVEMHFVREEIKGSRRSLRYSIDGPGLDHRGGTIWFDREAGYLAGFEIEKPDEPGYESGKLVLKEILEMKPESWSEFKMQQLKPAEADQGKNAGAGPGQL